MFLVLLPVESIFYLALPESELSAMTHLLTVQDKPGHARVHTPEGKYRQLGWFAPGLY